MGETANDRFELDKQYDRFELDKQYKIGEKSLV